MKKTRALEIVWRNSKSLQRRQRWEQINHGSAAAQYLVQELVFTPIGSYWMTLSSLEFVPGGKAA